MATIKRFEEIEAWKTAREVTRLVYELSKHNDFGRDFGLRDQIRRDAISVMSNIAEGFESRTQSLFIEFLGRAKGSAGEVRAQTYVALDAGYISAAQFQQLVGLAETCSRQVSGFITYLQTHPSTKQAVRDGQVNYTLDNQELEASAER